MGRKFYQQFEKFMHGIDIGLVLKDSSKLANKILEEGILDVDNFQNLIDDCLQGKPIDTLQYLEALEKQLASIDKKLSEDKYLLVDLKKFQINIKNLKKVVTFLIYDAPTYQQNISKLKEKLKTAEENQEKITAELESNQKRLKELPIKIKVARDRKLSLEKQEALLKEKEGIENKIKEIEEKKSNLNSSLELVKKTHSFPLTQVDVSNFNDENYETKISFLQEVNKDKVEPKVKQMTEKCESVTSEIKENKKQLEDYQSSLEDMLQKENKRKEDIKKINANIEKATVVRDEKNKLLDKRLSTMEEILEKGSQGNVLSSKESIIGEIDVLCKKIAEEEASKKKYETNLEKLKKESNGDSIKSTQESINEIKLTIVDLKKAFEVNKKTENSLREESKKIVEFIHNVKNKYKELGDLQEEKKRLIGNYKETQKQLDAYDENINLSSCREELKKINDRLTELKKETKNTKNNILWNRKEIETTKQKIKNRKFTIDKLTLRHNRKKGGLLSIDFVNNKIKYESISHDLSIDDFREKLKEAKEWCNPLEKDNLTQVLTKLYKKGDDLVNNDHMYNNINKKAAGIQVKKAAVNIVNLLMQGKDEKIPDMKKSQSYSKILEDRGIWEFFKKVLRFLGFDNYQNRQTKTGQIFNRALSFFDPKEKLKKEVEITHNRNGLNLNFS